MNIFVIGNGFDLAHGLLIKYGYFLKFIKVIRQILNVKGKEINDMMLGSKGISKLNCMNCINNFF